MPDLVEELKAKMDGAVRRLIAEHAGPLYGAALKLGFPPTDAEGLVQDTLTSFLEGVARFEGHSKLSTYLFGILHNKASELWRRQKREQPTEDLEALLDARFDARGLWSRPPQGPEESALAKDAQAAIERCAEGLSEDQRAAFFLREVEGEDTAAICNILGVSATNLGVLLFRARTKLRECLERSWGNR